MHTPTLHWLAGLAPLVFVAAAEAAVHRPAPAAPLTPPTSIRVLLGTYPQLAVAGTDLKINGARLSEGSAVFSLRCGSDASGSFVDYGTGTARGTRLEIFAPGGFLQVNGKLYRQRLSVLPRAEGCMVVNTLDLDHYLAGLLNKEMSPSWPLEALKAQAVASRSYALFQARQNRLREYDLESTTMDQVYAGAAAETPRSHQAVQETAGLVLSHARAPLKAYFHANCGGRTELPEAVWGQGSPAFRPVQCPYHHRQRDRLQWQVHLSAQQIEGALRRVAGLLPQSFVKLAHLEAGAPNPNQRLHDVVVSDARGQNLLLPANAFRAALGNTKVKSTAFRITASGSGYTIRGEGYGHGVGLCQVGARAMAEAGKKFGAILKHYYPLAALGRPAARTIASGLD